MDPKEISLVASAVGNHEEILVLDEQPVALGLRSAAAALGGLEGLA